MQFNGYLMGTSHTFRPYLHYGWAGIMMGGRLDGGGGVDWHLGEHRLWIVTMQASADMSSSYYEDAQFAWDRLNAKGILNISRAFGEER